MGQPAENVSRSVELERSGSASSIYNTYFSAVSMSAKNRPETEVVLDNDMGTGGISRMTTRMGLEFVQSDFCFQSNRTIGIKSNEAMAELSFFLAGGGSVEVGNSVHELVPGNCTLQFMQNFTAHFEYAGNARIHALAIGIPVAMFDDYIGDAGVQKSSFATLIGSRSFRMFRHTINAGTKRILNEMQACPYSMGMRRMFMEGKALELLSGYLNLFLLDREFLSEGVSNGLSRTDCTKLKKARDILLERMDAPPSLLELSRLVGLNDYKLKMGFKEMFGTSVFAYLRGQRMERAWEGLQSGEVNVSAAAAMVGYANFSHFASAFRKQYGVNPSELIKSAQQH
ncbi:AraC family transcriptional regulator [Paenibacillaceae bacterium]|nr:AraC family transcriptional regulator [Paenibacillaceae bacterium]